MILLLFIIGIVTYLVFFYSKLRKLPPGPIPFPIIGNVPQLGLLMLQGKGLIDGLRDWQKYYGDVYTLWIGPLATVNICEHQLAQETMVKKGNNYADRPYLYLMWLIREGRGVIASNGQHWMEQRRFSLHTLRNFGLGRNLMEDRIMLEVDYRCKLLDRDISNAKGELTLNLAHHLDVTVGNIINRLLFSERFTEENEKKFFDIKAVMDQSIEDGTIFDFYMDSWNANYYPFKAKHDKMIHEMMQLCDFIKKQIDEKKEEIASGKRDLRQEPEDFVDAFLIQMQKEDDTTESFTEDSLLMTLVDLWFAGQETTATTLYWAFSYLTLNPQVIKKAQAELDEVTGRNRALSLADKPKTVYLNAIISEVLRISSIVVFNLWRTAAEDTQIGKFNIEKGTAVTAQLCLINTDPDRFVDGKAFNPDRFLNSNLDQYSTAFGMGKRACLGESLARAELYLIMGNFLLNYEMVADPENPPSMDSHKEFANLRRAKTYKVTMSKRA